ncbi:MAG: 50S ribosomal protein L18a [Zestosphaera tikiterensis]|uniref:Large ribosomal subunit protein eL20 n=1 Tax=Zestosphaera tikiterensis TaxID=1973259 RepID=A0A2R7Y766_9CREN|nr:MAG: 50S ribosomal protein L18a [Zestosphaera tikiterensis]
MEVKTFRVVGLALFSPDRTRDWQKFMIDVRGVNEKEALEKVYSLMGSRHKLKRSHIKVVEIREISPEESKSKYIREISALEGWSVE